ncbi:MAG: DUF1656 domain-containing protein [Pseudolabrys sp.]|jgi:hypothetical protein
MPMIPHEIDLAGVLVSPLLIASIFGLPAAWLTAKGLNRLRLSQYFAYPPLVLLALIVIYTGLISVFLIPA